MPDAPTSTWITLKFKNTGKHGPSIMSFTPRDVKNGESIHIHFECVHQYQKILERLKELIEQGLVKSKIDDSSFPIKSEYRLTDSTRELMLIVHDIKMWALIWNVDNKPCKNQDCRVCIL